MNEKESLYMSLGKQIAAARKMKGLSQPQLAEMIGVSPEAISKWELDAYQPGRDKLVLLEKVLPLFFFDSDGNPRNMRLFHEDHMSSFLKGKLKACNLQQSLSALSYAKDMHEGVYRKPKEANVPYINHPLTMACHALALGLTDDELIAAILLHDVSEDCDIPASELPFSEGVQKLVSLVTKTEPFFNEKAYYAAISGDPKACLVKCIDRCNNLSGMSFGFSADKIEKYVKETETYYPELLRTIKECPNYNDAAFLLEYQMKGLVEMAKRVH